MQANICKSCGYANMYSSRECINCGASLFEVSTPGYYDVSEEIKRPPDTRSLKNNPHTRSSRQVVRPTPSEPLPIRKQQSSQSYSTQRAENQRGSTQHKGPSLTDEEHQRGIIRYKGPSLTDQQNQRGIIRYKEPSLIPTTLDDNPYETTMDVDLYHPQDIPFRTDVKEEQDPIDLEPWKTDRLPWYLPRRRPHLSGRIIHIHNEMEFPDFPNVLRAIVDVMSEFLWIAANQPTHKEGERVQITIIRMRTNEGQLKDARIMGYMRGANLSLGDLVSFWGWRRRGSLIVRTGYNHTSKATITTNMMSMLLPGLIILAVIGAIFLFTVYQANFFSFLHSFWR